MYKIHRQNHDFQIAYFIAGSCHTPDGAYAMLQGLKENREEAINNYHVQELKIKAKKLRAEKLLKGDEADKLEAQSKLLEIENNKKSGKILYDAAVDELNFINKCISIINPLRKYKDLSDSEAYELAQREEWKFELIRRAENSLLTTGAIPTDHYNTMRLHPDFKTDILSSINKITLMIQNNDDEEILKHIEPTFNLPKLLK
jgi:hypothetical protein